jgi:ABC-type branched-subunit amino acid transport system substrate-binding protein
MGRRCINAKGGVNGKKIEMIVLDTQADPQVPSMPSIDW